MALQAPGNSGLQAYINSGLQARNKGSTSVTPPTAGIYQALRSVTQYTGVAFNARGQGSLDEMQTEYAEIMANVSGAIYSGGAVGSAFANGNYANQIAYPFGPASGLYNYALLGGGAGQRNQIQRTRWTLGPPFTHVQMTATCTLATAASFHAAGAIKIWSGTNTGNASDAFLNLVELHSYPFSLGVGASITEEITLPAADYLVAGLYTELALPSYTPSPPAIEDRGSSISGTFTMTWS